MVPAKIGFDFAFGISAATRACEHSSLLDGVAAPTGQSVLLQLLPLASGEIWMSDVEKGDRDMVE